MVFPSPSSTTKPWPSKRVGIFGELVEIANTNQIHLLHNENMIECSAGEFEEQWHLPTSRLIKGDSSTLQSIMISFIAGFKLLPLIFKSCRFHIDLPFSSKTDLYAEPGDLNCTLYCFMHDLVLQRRNEMELWCTSRSYIVLENVNMWYSSNCSSF